MRRTISAVATLLVGVLLSAMLSACGGGPATQQAPPSDRAPKAHAATARFKQLDDAYASAAMDLARAVSAKPVDMAAVRAGARKAAAAYEVRLNGLRRIDWPGDVRPDAVRMILLTTGTLGALKRAETARSMADLTRPADVEAVRRLDRSEAALRIKLGRSHE